MRVASQVAERLKTQDLENQTQEIEKHKENHITSQNYCLVLNPPYEMKVLLVQVKLYGKTEFQQFKIQVKNN